MRRVIAAISNFMDVGDTTTLANPEVVEMIRKHVQSTKLRDGAAPRAIPKELEEELRRFGDAS
jgi:acetyl-CoA synthetase